jgi:hypothetical protein
VRAVATNTFRVATNAKTFLPQAERSLGFPIDIITGHEEARLIYNGVAHVLPASSEPRLVIDIGGGSTEFIIGRGLEPERLESLQIGCVGMTQRFFPDGRLTAQAFAAADTVARTEIETIAGAFHREHWVNAFASSGTALALAEILEQNGLSAAGITPDGLARLKKRMVGCGHIERLRLTALKPERVPVLAPALPSWRRRSPSSASPASTRSAARCASAFSTISSGARCAATSVSRPSTSSPRVTASIARMRRASPRWPLRCTRAPFPPPIRRPQNGSNGQRCSTRPAFRCRTPGITNTARTFCRTPTCRGFPRASSTISRSSF